MSNIMKELKEQEQQLAMTIKLAVQELLTEDKIKDSIKGLEEIVELIGLGLRTEGVAVESLTGLEKLIGQLTPINDTLKRMSGDNNKEGIAETSMAVNVEVLNWRTDDSGNRCINIPYKPRTHRDDAMPLPVGRGGTVSTGERIHASKILSELNGMEQYKTLAVHGLNKEQLELVPLKEVLNIAGPLHIWLINNTTEVIGFKTVNEFGDEFMRLLWVTTTFRLTLSGQLIQIDEGVQLLKTFRLD